MVKLLSNFDTKFDDQCVQDAVNEFDRNHICFVRRDKIYVILKILLPTLIRLIIALTLILIAYWSGLWKVLWYYFQIFIRLVIAVSWAILLRKVTDKLIDYYMDFTIITPKQVTAHDQSWLFTRKTRSLNIKQIKSVRVDQSWILRSLFNFGSIIFFSEGDDVSGDITLNFISDPNSLRKRLQQIIDVFEDL